MTTGKTEEFNFVQAGPGGLCFAHGPYTEGHQCPKFPACINDPHNPEYVATGARLISAPKERARLEREVVEAAKAAHKAEHDWLKYGAKGRAKDIEEWDRLAAIECDKARELNRAVTALLSFEEKQKK